jgi:hypothetical protein
MRSSWFGSLGLALAGTFLISSVGVAATELPSAGPGFGDYELVPLLDEATAYAGPETPTSLDEVRVSRLVDEQLPAGAEALLAEQGFVVVPAELRLFHQAYGDQYASGTPVYVTTDAAYHAWHLVFDKILRDVEQQRLLPVLDQLVMDMRQNAVLQRNELAGTALADDAARVVDLLAVTANVLGVRSGKLSERARAEKQLIEAHTRYTESPILGTPTDYSLFTPRGHYTRNEDLTRYFVAMSVLGQHAFLLPGSRLPGGGRLGDETAGLRRAILASRTLVGNPELEAMWRQVFEPTAFLVGVSDDYTPFELQAAVEASAPGAWTDPSMAADDDTILRIADALAAAREVRIDPERPSVRLMGTRFVLDSWILDQLVSPNVGTQADPRVLGSPLDIAAAFGSDFALAIQESAGETAKANYPEQLAAMRTAVAARPDEAWGATVYDAWLAAVEPMWLPRGEAFPDFMRRDAWAAKSQQTGFGSYAELKHDTILYTKQAGGDTTGGPPEPRPARNWVEPDPVPLGRLSAMAALTRAGLDERGLLPGEQRQLLDFYIELVDRLARLASEELAGEPISEEDNVWLRSIGGELETVWVLTGDSPDRTQPAELDEDAAVIADIMRGLDTMAGTDEVLEVGTGTIDRIYVIVPDDAGRFHVASGGVYSYYEFPWPTPDRLTDEAWRKMLRKDQVPERPAWQGVLFADPTATEEPEPKPTPRPSRAALERELGTAIAGATWEPYRSSPRGVTHDPFEYGAIGAVLFDELNDELDRSVDYVALFRFRNNDYLDGYWQWRTWDAEGAPMRTLPCADGRPGRDTWLHGEYLCYVSDDGVALLRWTDERSGTYGVMNGVAGRKDLARLYRAWTEIARIGEGSPPPDATAS